MITKPRNPVSMFDEELLEPVRDTELNYGVADAIVGGAQLDDRRQQASKARSDEDDEDGRGRNQASGEPSGNQPPFTVTGMLLPPAGCSTPICLAGPRETGGEGQAVSPRGAAGAAEFQW